MVSRGHQVAIASLNQGKESLLELLDKRIAFYHLESKTTCSSNVKNLRKILQDRSIDWLINQWALPFAPNRLCKKAMAGLNCRLMSVLHIVPNNSKIILKLSAKENSSLLLKPFWKMAKMAAAYTIKRSIRFVYSLANHYVLLSESYKDQIAQYASLKDSSKLQAIPNPLTIISEPSGVPVAKEKMLLFVGRMDYTHKRVDRVVQVWETMAEKYPDWNLTLVGNGPYLPELKEYVVSHQIPRVNFVDPLDGPPVEYYRRASVLMLTSDLEGFGLVITEGMHYGVVPVVYGSYSAAYDIVDDGKCGYVIPTPYSMETMRDRLARLMDDESLRTKMAEQAVEKSKVFEIEPIYNRWMELMK